MLLERATNNEIEVRSVHAPLAETFYLVKQKQAEQIHIAKQMSGTFIIFQYVYKFNR